MGHKRRTRSHAQMERLEVRQLLAAATVNFNTVYQTMDGFGVQPGIGQDPNPPDSALQLAFSQTNGIGLEFIRGSLSANGYNQIIGMSQRAAAYGAQLVMSPRGPAVAWLNDYGNATNGELNPAHYQDYANMVADFLQNSAAQGLPVYSVSMAVEPDLITSICPQWNGQEFANLLPDFVSAFQARGLTTRIMVNEDVGFTNTDRNQIMADPALSQYVSIVANHGYGQAYNPYQLFSNNMGKHVWMTENIPQISTDTQLQNAILTATDIHNCITIANASAYLDCFLNFGTQGLMSSWTSPNLCLYSMGNFSKFVRPGWVRVGETDDGGLLLTTFKDPVSGKFAIVAINSGTSNISETYTLNGLSAASVTPYTTSASSNLAAGSVIPISGGAFTATIPASSVVTYYGISSSAATLQAPVALNAGTSASAQTSQIALSWTDNSTIDTDYTVERSTDGTNWTVLTSTLPAGTTTYVDTGLNEASTYYYRVQATNGASASPFSAVATGSTILAAPSGVSSSGTSTGRNLSWSINSGVSTGVTIQRSTDGLIWSTIATLNTRATSYSDTIPGYNSNEIYWYRVRNTYGSQTSSYGAYNTIVNTPSNFKATLASPTSVTLSWTNNAVGAYAAYINQNGTLITPPNLSANAGSFTTTGLTENTTYSFTVQALGPEAWFRPSAGITYGAWSSSASTSITTPVAAPTGLTAVSTVTGTAVLNWVDNSAVETAYDVERSTNGTTWTVLSSTLAANSSSYTDTSAPASPVFYRVKAIDSTVSSAYVQTQMVSAVPLISTNATVTGTTTSLTASPPSGFGTGTLTYLWSLVGTPPGNVNFSTNNTSTPATTATFTVAGSYVFRVTITDASGNSTSATTNVTVAQSTTSIGIQDSAARASYGGPTAPTPSITASTWEQLVATAYDQFGNSLTSQPSFSWSVVSGGGSVSSGGLYSAPANAAAPVVRATTGSVSGQVMLNVIAAPQVLADYSFNETSGYTVNDNLGAGVPGYISGGASLVPGRVGDAVSFDGASGSVWLGNPTSLDIRGQITMAAWIDPSSTSGTQTIISRGYGFWPNYGGTFLRIANGQYQVGYYNGSYYDAAFTMPAGDVGQWVYLAGTYDGKNWNLYRNGSLVATYASTVGSIYAADAWRIGSTDIPADYFNGKIDDVRLYAQALPVNQINNVYSQGLTLTATAAATPATTTTYSTTLTAAAIDPDSNSDSDLTYTWSLLAQPAGAANPIFGANGTSAARSTVVTFTSPGLYRFGVTISDSSGIVHSLTSSVYVIVQGSAGVAPTVASPASASPGTVTGTTTALSVLGADANGEASLTYLWSGTGPSAVSFVNNGNNSAKNTTAVFTSAGAYVLTVQIIDTNGLVVTSSVNVTVTATLTTIAVSPNAPTVTAGATQSFSAGGVDQFGNAISASFTWSITSGGGTINASSGLYTAPSSQGGLIGITATSGSVKGTAVVTIAMDNADTGGDVTLSGTWTASTTVGGYFGSNYAYSNTAGNTARFATTVPLAGQYAVYAHWTSSSNRNGAVPFNISTGTSTSTVYINQQNSSGTWYVLGTYNFSAGSIGSVTIVAPSDAGANSSVIADAVELVLVNAAPTIVKTATATPSVIAANGSTTLSVLGSDNAGESKLIYTWAATSMPNGAVAPVFSDNGTNSAKNTLASFTTPGNYTLSVTATDPAGLTTLSSIALVVVPTTYIGTIGNDTYTLRLSPTDNTLEQIFVNTPATGAPTYTIPRAQLNSLSFNMASDGSLTVDFSNGNPLPSTGITINGGQSLVIDGASTGGLSFNISSAQLLYNSTASSPINFTNLANVQLNLLGGGNSLIQTAQPGASLTYNAGGGSNTLTINGGSYTIISDPANASGNLTINDNASLIFAPPTPGSGYNTRNLAALNLGPNATATLTAASTASDRTVLLVGAINLASGASLDLKTNALIVHNTSAGSITPWIGSGIISSSAISDPSHLTTLGILANNQSGSPRYNSFDNQTLQLNDVIVRDTYYGDANLDGSVTSTDYTYIDNGYLTHATGWQNGDFNYDGVVNGSDYTLIDNAFNQQVAVLAAQIAAIAPATNLHAVLTSPVPAARFAASPVHFVHRSLQAARSIAPAFQSQPTNDRASQFASTLIEIQETTDPSTAEVQSQLLTPFGPSLFTDVADRLEVYFQASSII